MHAVLEDNNGQRLVIVNAREHSIRVTSQENIILFTSQRARTRIRFTQKESQQRATITFLDYPGVTLNIFDNDAIENLRLTYLNNPELSGNNDASFRMMFVIIIIFAVGVFISLASYLDLAAGAITRITPKHWETYTANLALERMRASGTCNNKRALQHLAQLVNPLKESADITGYPPLRIIPVSANGGAPKFFALPGAVAVINDAYLTTVKDADRLAAAIARKLIHIRNREPLKRFVAGAGSMTLAAALLPFLDGTEPAASAASRLLNSDSNEESDIEEDEETVTLMLKAGIRANGVILILNDEKNASFLPSPGITARIEHLERLLQEGEPRKRQQELMARSPLSPKQMHYITRICM